MRLHLSGVVALGSAIPAAMALALARSRATGPAARAALLLLSHAAVVGAAVSIAASPVLARKSTGLLGKDPSTGRIPLWSLLAFAPYHAALAARLASQRARRAGTEPPFDRLDFPDGGGGWFLGTWPDTARALPPGVAAIIDVTAELPKVAGAAGLPYLCLPVWDTWAPTTPQIEAALAFAARHEQKEPGSRVYVHCANGHGRSAVLAVARVLAGGGGGGSVDGAVARVRAARPRARLNARQRAAVEDWWAWRRDEGGEWPAAAAAAG